MTWVAFLAAPSPIGSLTWVVSDPIGLGAAKNATHVIGAITLPFASQVPRVPSLNFSDSEGLFGFGSYRDFNRNHNWFDNLSWSRSEEHTSELQSRLHLVCRLLLEKKNFRTGASTALNSP